MINYKYKATVVAISIWAVLLSMQSCHLHDDAKKQEKDEKFKVTESMLNSFLIDTVKEANALSQITLTGSIAPDENKLVRVYPMVSGVAQDINVAVC